MIINSPFSRGYESKRHILAKTRAATICDKYLERLKHIHQKKWKIVTIYEYRFPQLLTPLGAKTYCADVFVDLSYMTEHQLRHHCMSIEVDGILGHAGEHEQMKDRVRDERLSQQINCPVIRFATDDLVGLKRKKPSLLPDLSALTDDEVLMAMDPVATMKLSHILGIRPLQR